VFTKVDLRNACNFMHKRRQWMETMFHTRYGHFKNNVMPFGFKNALAIFQHMMNNIFENFLDDSW